MPIPTKYLLPPNISIDVILYNPVLIVNDTPNHKQILFFLVL